MTNRIRPSEATLKLRPKLARWLFAHDQSYEDCAEGVGVTREYIRRLCLPFDDPKRAKPGIELMARIMDWTRGDVRADDWLAPFEELAA